MTTIENLRMGASNVQDERFYLEASYNFRQVFAGDESAYIKLLERINALGGEAGISSPALTLSSPHVSIHFRGMLNPEKFAEDLSKLVNDKLLDVELLNQIIDLARPHIRHGNFGCTQLWSLAAKLITHLGLTLRVRNHSRNT